MATIQDLLNMAYQIRDAEQNGENTALRVGQFLVELVNHFNTKADVDNISGAYHLKQQQAPIMALMSVQQMSDSDGQDNKAWWSTDGHIKYQHNGRIYDLGTPAFMLYYCGDKIYKWTGSATGFQLMTDGGSSGGGASVFANFAVAASTNELPDNGVATTGYIVGQNLYAYVGTGGDTHGGKYQNLGELNAAGVSLTTNGDGTFTVHSGGNDYTVNLNHTHPNMAKLIVCEESGLPSTLDPATIYAITDSGETEIEKLIIRGMEFAGGGVPDTGMPQVTKPNPFRSLNLGTNTGSGVTALVDVKARNLNYNSSTDGLTVSVDQNSGLLLSYDQTVDAASITIPQQAAETGCQITVKYTGNGALDDGALVFSHDNAVLASVVVVVVVVVVDPYAGFLFDKALYRGALTDIQGKCVTPTFDLGSGGHFLTVRFGYDTGSYGASGYTSEDTYVDTWSASKVIRSVKLGDTVSKIRVTLDSNNLANCFIYDETANVMLFKGPGVAFDDPYPGVSFGQRIKPSSGGSIISDNSWCLSPILELSATGHTVSVNFGIQQTGASGSGLAGYTADGSFVELFATNAAQRTIDLSSYPSIKKLMLPAYLSELENCYVHDDTSDEYLWKGLNVV